MKEKLPQSSPLKHFLNTLISPLLHVVVVNATIRGAK